MLRGLAEWCYRRRRLVVVTWIVALIGVSVLAQTVGGDLLKTFSLPGTESQRDVRRAEAATSRARATPATSCSRCAGDGTVRRPRGAAARSSRCSRSSRKQPHVVSVTSSVRPGRRALHLAGRQDRLRRDPVRRAGERRADRSRDGHARRSSKDANSRRVQVELGGLHVHRPDAARERADRHPRRDRHPADRVRIAARDGPADHDRAVRHRDRPRGRARCSRACSTSRRSRRRSPR